MSNNPAPRKQLGRGLASLMADTRSVPINELAATDGLRMVVPSAITPNPDQPRRSFNSDQLEDLAQSLRETGMLQPLIVRPIGEAGQYQIVAGERRWRAAQLAGMAQIPVILRQYTDIETLQIAIIENVQRADLNPMEEAQAYRDLVDRFGHSQEQVASGLGKSRSHIANMMRLLLLPDSVIDLVRNGRLSAGHARALIPDADPEKAAQIILDRSLSVRETEALVRKRSQGHKPQHLGASASGHIKDLEALQIATSRTLGRQVGIKEIRRTGELALTMTCKDEADLQALIALLVATGTDQHGGS